MHCVSAPVALFFALLASACAPLPPGPTAPALEPLLAEAARLRGERRPRSALAVLAPLPLPDDPLSAASLVHARVGASFDANLIDQAAAGCDQLAGLLPDAPGWRPLCWEVRLESAADRTRAAAGVAQEIDALLARAPNDFSHLQAAYRGHLARWDRAAREPLLERLAAAAASPAERDYVSANLFEELLGAPTPEGRQALARRLLALAPAYRQADVVVRWVLATATPPDLATARGLLGLDAAALPSWRVALGLAEWALERGDVARPAEIADLLARAEREAGPETLEPPPSGLDAAARAWLWDRVAVRLALARARLFRLQGEPDRAAQVLRAAPTADPPSAEVALLLGELAAAAGADDAAIAHFAEALAAGPLPAAETQLAALLAARHGHPGPARDWFLARAGGPAFDDVTAAAGLAGVRAQRVAWGDADGDGAPDLLLDGRLFRNDGRGRFDELPRPPGPPVTGGLWADVDGDGAADLLLTGGERNRLLLNRGAAGWMERPLPDAAHRRTEAAAYADLDGDGDLDLYLANYERGGSRRGLCNADQLLLNDGHGGFSDATAAAGMVTETPLCGRGLAWSDVDGDGRPDAVVGNYRLGPNLLWRNRGDGRFVEAGAAWGVRGANRGGAFGHTIAVAPGDLDGDGREDLVLTNLAHPRFIEFSDRTQLLLSGAGTPPPLGDRRAAAGLHFAETESDAALGDVDNDGDLDLLVTAIYPGRWSRLYLNDGHGRFRDVSWRAGARVANGWGAAFADADGDGALDLLVASADGVRLLRNRGPGGHWLAVRLDDPRCNRAGVGARVTLRAGARVQVRTVRIGRGTGSQDDLTLHFGLGRHAGPVELEAVNACGQRFGATVPRPDRRVTLHGPR